MRNQLSKLWAALAPVVLLAAQAVAARGAELPLNQWTRLPHTLENGYRYSGAVWAADRGQVLHWGAMAHVRDLKTGTNDVRAFDAGALRWLSDYESDPGQSWSYDGGGSGGRAVSYCGKGAMTPSGRPFAAMIVNAIAYDSKRRQVVVSMPGLMAAYDPATREWRDMEATTDLHGDTLPGGPPVFGAGMCYDPVNDEIVMFPHFGAQCADLREVTGRISGHLGTLRYSFKDNTWRRARGELGTAQQREARAQAVELLGRLSPILDEVWKLRHQPDAAKLGELKKRLSAVAAGVEQAAVAAALREAGAVDSAPAVLAAGTRAVWALESRLENELAVEPPRRAVAPMVYDPKNRLIVLFGGDSGRIRPDLRDRIDDDGDYRALYGATDRRLNDTWVYDCATRQWRDVSTSNRPPAQRVPLVSYDPHSGRVLLVTIRGNPWHQRIPRRVTLWSLDAATGQWRRHLEQQWEGAIDRHEWYGSAIDGKNRLLLITHTDGGEQTTWAMRYDLGRMPSEPAPEWNPPPAIEPTTIPPDDPAWVEKLKSLPANKWVAADPPHEPNRRDWGNIACDQVRGWMVYFGGGHSTYQGTDVAIYRVGANLWVHQAGGHNDSLPPVGWGGFHVDAWGANNAGHMRNQYAAIDGRMYISAGFGAQIKPRPASHVTEAEIISLPDAPHAWFYDVDRGGVWRQTPTEVEDELPEPDRGFRRSFPHVADPAGFIYGIHVATQPYQNQPLGVRVCCYDVYGGRTTIKTPPEPWPHSWPESRPFCMLPDRGQIFLQDFDRKAGEAKRKGEAVDGPLMRTWVYDVRQNRFIDLKPANQPTPGAVIGTAYVQDQSCVLAIVRPRHGETEQWVYSLGHNRWQPLPLEADGRVQFQAPYTQIDYVTKHGVLVNVAGHTHLMRPEFEGLKW